jgi:hypothetical protein
MAECCSHHLAMQILYRLGSCFKFEGGSREWDCSMGLVAEWLAERTGKTVAAAKSMIQRLLDAPVPQEYCRYLGPPPPYLHLRQTGVCWKHLEKPYRHYQKAIQLGLLPEKGHARAYRNRSSDPRLVASVPS